MSWRHMGGGGIALPFLTSALDGGDWPASCLWEITPGTQWLGSWVGPRAGLDLWRREKSCLCQDSAFAVQPVAMLTELSWLLILTESGLYVWDSPHGPSLNPQTSLISMILKCWVGNDTDVRKLTHSSFATAVGAACPLQLDSIFTLKAWVLLGIVGFVFWNVLVGQVFLHILWFFLTIYAYREDIYNSANTS
jgi:hypothetical protein